jgi:hypothetical protein
MTPDLWHDGLDGQVLARPGMPSLGMSPTPTSLSPTSSATAAGVSSRARSCGGSASSSVPGCMPSGGSTRRRGGRLRLAPPELN